MSSHYLVRLVVILAIVQIGASITASKLLPVNSADLTTTRETDISSTTRFLRAYSVGSAGEDRGFPETFISLVSSKTIPQKIQDWLKKEKSSDEVFKRLNLDKAGPRLFTNRQFAVWVQYADDMSAKKPGMSAISTLIRQYGDDVLFEMIKRAKMNSRTQDLAAKLEAQQMQYWLATRKDPDEVFQLFKLNKAGGKVLKNSEFAAWVKYVDDLTIKYPEEPTFLTPTLAKYINGERLFEVTSLAKNSDDTRDIATRLEGDWLKAGIHSKKTPEKAFLDLGFGQAADVLIERSSLLTTWEDYLKAFNKKYPNEKTTMIETFTKVFGDADVTKMLAAAKKIDYEYARNMATNLEAAQLEMWLHGGKSTDDVFKLLKLDKSANTFKDKPLLTQWVTYIDLFLTENPNKMASLFSGLQTHFKDRRLNEILNIVHTFPKMESTATKIQAEKIRSYLVKNEEPTNVFELLALDDIGDDVLGTPLFHSWMKYVEDFNKQNPDDKTSWLTTLNFKFREKRLHRAINRALENQSTAKMGKMVQNAVLQEWLDQKTPPKLVFHFLELRKAEEQALVSPRFEAWAKYLDDFNKRYPDDKTTMLDAINYNINIPNLLLAFNVAKKNPSTEKVAVNLENAIIDSWLAANTDLAYLKEWLGKRGKELIDRYVKMSAAKNTT
ncbi:RxLR effector protein [Phytophthora megakarya]|uniref:RxLR effector protein n=1 Tax=Phytophthora megakarya TaxID=4795 RepID=A0A225VU74_9STRA|nr:RxLR effector protein [Phytophthora megakarya]